MKNTLSSVVGKLFHRIQTSIATPGTTSDSGLRTSDSGLRTPDFPLRGRRSAFTLIELLIVVALMAMLMTLLGGGIRKSMDNAKKRQRSTELQTLETAILTYWHDTGKPPITTKKGVYAYSYTDDNNTVFNRLLDANHKENQMGKAYLDINQLRTAAEGHVRPMRRPSESIADPYGNFYKVTIDLETKNAKVQYKDKGSWKP